MKPLGGGTGTSLLKGLVPVDASEDCEVIVPLGLNFGGFRMLYLESSCGTFFEFKLPGP